MFSDEQSNDGYSWAYSYDWYATGNALPVAYDITMTASIDDDCAGAKMFGSYHPNKKNLPASSFAFYINGDATYSDPADETEGYNYLQGLRKDGSAYPNEIAGDLYDQKFAFYGDPNSSNGHSTSNPIDGNYASAADRRSLMSVGPFTMAQGDSQEIVFNIMHAEGASSLEALANLFTANDSIQTYYNNDFSLLAETNVERAISISAAQTTGTAPHTITFSLNSTFSFPVYEWDFNGDGITDSSSQNPTYTYNESGEYTVTAIAKYRYYEDGIFNMKSITDSLSVTILDNSAITITADSLVTNEDTSLSSVLTISNPSNRSYILQLELTPTNGVVSFNNATMNYTPNKNFNGLDSLKVFAKDGAYESSEALIQINVLPVDDTPVTGDVAVSTNEDTAVTVYLTASEYDGDTYEFEIKENPAYGSLSSILSTAGVDSVIYTPDADWFGTDQFKFEASDSSSRMNLGTAVIQVLPINDAPITEDMTVETYEDVTTPISLPFSDIDDDQISISATSPSHGSIEINNSYVEYIPDTNYFGDDAFTYYVNDGELDSNTSTISIALGPVNDASSEFTVSEEYTVNSSTGDEWVITTNNLIATPQNEQDSLQFNWEESFDIDGDKIQYRMIGYDALEFLTMDSWITDLTLSWSIKDLVSYTDTVNVASGSWIIVATDGEFFKESNFGNPMELFINGSALVPDAYTLNQNYPNPFSSSTTITYDMPETQKVMIRIFDIKGRLIRTLANEDQNAGFKTVIWDGKNDDGDKVSTGMYFYQMHAPSSLNFNGLTTTKKMIKLD
jgi:PKD repeat protein